MKFNWILEEEGNRQGGGIGIGKEGWKKINGGQK